METVLTTVKMQGAFLHEEVFDCECLQILYVHFLFFRRNEHSLIFASFYTDIMP